MGRKQFEQVVAQASREQVIQNINEITTSLGAGLSETIYIFAGENTVAEVIGMILNAEIPPGGASGTHDFFVGYEKIGQTALGIDVTLGRSAFGAKCYYNYGFWVNAATLAYPGDAVSQGAVIRQLKFDSQKGLKIRYSNGTNVAQTLKRTIHFQYVQREVRV